MLAADYCQVELRMMAHLSRDAGLCELLGNPSRDPFLHLAARWKRTPAHLVPLIPLIPQWPNTM